MKRRMRGAHHTQDVRGSRSARAYRVVFDLNVCTRFVLARRTKPASVPSSETAPSVPRGTRSNVVERYVVLPYALPISDCHVSDSLVASEATYAALSAARAVTADGGSAANASAASAPVAAAPQTFSGPRAPPRASAIPSASFWRCLTLVTAELCGGGCGRDAADPCHHATIIEASATQ